jgi:hypothetical protein
VEIFLQRAYRMYAGRAAYRQPKHDDKGELTDLQILGEDGTSKEIDFVTVLPTASTYLNHAAHTPRYAANVVASDKKIKHGQSCLNAGIDFVAFAIELYGTLGEDAVAELQALAGLAVDKHEDLYGYSEMCRHLKEAVAVATQRGNALAFTRYADLNKSNAPWGSVSGRWVQLDECTYAHTLDKSKRDALSYPHLTRMQNQLVLNDTHRTPSHPAPSEVSQATVRQGPTSTPSPTSSTPLSSSSTSSSSTPLSCPSSSSTSHAHQGSTTTGQSASLHGDALNQSLTVVSSPSDPASTSSPSSTTSSSSSSQSGARASTSSSSSSSRMLTEVEFLAGEVCKQGRSLVKCKGDGNCGTRAIFKHFDRLDESIKVGVPALGSLGSSKDIRALVVNHVTDLNFPLERRENIFSDIFLDAKSQPWASTSRKTRDLAVIKWVDSIREPGQHVDPTFFRAFCDLVKADLEIVQVRADRGGKRWIETTRLAYDKDTAPLSKTKAQGPGLVYDGRRVLRVAYTCTALTKQGHYDLIVEDDSSVLHEEES